MTVRYEARRAFVVPANVLQAWDFLWDVESLALCIPGCHEAVAVKEGEAYDARICKPIGPFRIDFALVIAVVGRDRPKNIALTIKGADTRLRTEVRQVISVWLDEETTEVTAIEIRADTEVDGVLASLGRNLVRMHIDQVLDEFIASITATLKEKALHTVST